MDIAHWIRQWVFTYDPRLISQGLPATLPLDPFPRQLEFLDWLKARETKQQDGLVEKSREVGVTWLCCCYAIHGWLYRPGFRAGFGSRKLELVDTLGDHKSIFEKMRVILRNLPPKLLPRGWHAKQHDNYCKLINPENEATITGEGGDDIGRGDRCSMYFVDESASLEHPEMIDAALSQTTQVRIDVSTPKGDCRFADRRKIFAETSPEQLFTFHWRDDPRKDEAWYQAQRKRLVLPWIIAQELDIDHGGAGGAREFPGEWFKGDGIWFDDWPSRHDTLLKVISLDPSKGKGGRLGDYSAFVIVYMTKDVTLYVDADMDNTRPTTKIVTDGIELFKQHNPDAMCCEINQFQELLAKDFIREAQAQRLMLPMFGFDNMVNKEVRIRRLAPILAGVDGRIRFKRGSRGTQLLVAQLQDFRAPPHPHGYHDDGPDSLEQGQRLLMHLMLGGKRDAPGAPVPMGR